MAYFCQNRLAIVLKQAAQSCKTVVFRWRNRAIYSLEKQSSWYALLETAFSLFTASQILFSARGVFDHSLCHRRDWNRRADIYNGKRLTTGRTIYGSRRGKEKRGALWTVQTERRKPPEFGFDHMFYHRQSRSTWEIWARKCQRRNAVE